MNTGIKKRVNHVPLSYIKANTHEKPTMKNKKNALMMYASIDTFLDICEEKEEITLFNYFIKEVSSDPRFTSKVFLQEISKEFEQSFKRITAQNSMNKYALLSFIVYLINSYKRVDWAEAQAKELFAKTPKDPFVYDKLGVSENELNIKLFSSLRRILDKAIVKHKINIR